MNRTNQTLLGTLGALFTLCLACFMCGKNLINAEQGGDHYWTHGCVTGDEAMLVVGGDEAASIDLSTGAALETTPLFVEAVSCGAKAGVAYASSEDAVRFPSGERGATDESSTMDLVGTTRDGALVHFSRETDGKGRPRKFARAWQGAPGVAGEALELAPALFGEVGSAHSPMPSAFINKVGNLLPDGRLVLAAGWIPNRSGDDVEAAPWGVFAIDLNAGEVTPLTGTLTCSPKLDTSLLWKVAASRDGQRVAAAFRGDGRTRVAVFEGEEALFTAELTDAREPTALEFSPEGDRLAVATLDDSGGVGKLTWLDVATGAPAWTSGELAGTVHFLQHLSDGSLVFITSKRMVARVGRDGVSRWK